MSIRAINHLSFIFNNTHYLPKLYHLNPLVSLELLAKTAHETAMLINWWAQRFESMVSLARRINHTTYGHSRSPTWQPFMSIAAEDYPYCSIWSWIHPLTRVFQMQPIGVVIPRESYTGYGSLVAHKLHQFTAPIGYGMWLVSSIAAQGKISNGP